MTLRNHSFVAMAFAAALVCINVDSASAGGDDDRDDRYDGDRGWDDGRALLPQAAITFADARAAALKVASGPVHEVDLEYFRGKLVFDVDIGAKSVNIDAVSGAVLTVTDRYAERDDDDYDDD